MGQGLSLSQHCQNIGEKAPNCTITFSPGTTDRVISFDAILKGEFQGNPDIAGAGVFTSFRTLSVFVLVAGLILGGFRLGSLVFTRKEYRFRASMNRSNIIHMYLDSFILSSADTQLFLVLAIGAAFYYTERCSISLYHYLVLYHIVCIGMWTTILAFVLSRSPFKSPLCSVLRLVAMILCTIVLRNNKSLIGKDKRRADNHIRVPGHHQRDSLLILSAYCVIEPSMDPLANLTTSQQDHLNNTGMRRSRDFDQTIPMLYIVIIITIYFLFSILVKRWPGLLGNVLARVSPSDKEDQNNKAIWRFWLSLILKYTLWVAIFVIIVHNWRVIGALRRWVDQSIWLKLDAGGGNSESSYRGVGQLAPLFSLGALCFAFLDGMWEHLKDYSWLECLSGDYEDQFGDQHDKKAEDDGIPLV